MKPNKTDAHWQRLLEDEKLRLMALPPEELRALDWCTSCEIRNALDYVLWHTIQTETVRSVPEETRLQAQTNHFVVSEIEIHCLVLQASRKLFLGFGRNYLAGFALDNADQIIPIPDEILYAYD